MTDGFFEKLRRKMDSLGTSVVAGIDPSEEYVNVFQNADPSGSAYDFLFSFSKAIVDGARGKSPAVKFQSAFFEAFGVDGSRALRDAIQYASAADLLVILDAKRGDLSTTMRAYGRAAFDALKADCLTTTVYLGTAVLDAIEPWLRTGKSTYVVLVTSNPEGRAVQEPFLSDGKTSISHHVLKLTKEWVGERGDQIKIGYVVGANHLGSLDPSLAADLSNGHVLAPGLGAQGAVLDSEARKAVQSFATCALPVSRGLYPSSKLRHLAWTDLSESVSTGIKLFNI